MQFVVSIGLLFLSSVFMIIAWYWHLKHPNMGLVLAIGISWFIALFEYMLQVPANRIGYQVMTASELRTLHIAFSTIAFIIFAAWYLDEPMRWNHAVGFLFLVLGTGFVFYKS